MGLRKIFTKKAAQVVEKSIEPIKENLAIAKEAATRGTGLVGNILKILVTLAIGALVVLHDDNELVNDIRSAVPSSITINNYINSDRKDDDDAEK